MSGEGESAAEPGWRGGRARGRKRSVRLLPGQSRLISANLRLIPANLGQSRLISAGSVVRLLPGRRDAARDVDQEEGEDLGSGSGLGC